MDAIAVDIQPGVVDHGTDSRSEGRWLDASFVRWTNGVLHPIGGWEELSSVSISQSAARVGRGSHAWYDNSGIPRIAVGTWDKLYAWAGDPATGLVDITPSVFTTGYLNADENLSYGGKDYGEGSYGVARQSDGQTVQATCWHLDNFGQNLIALSTADNKIYQWALSSVATQVSNAPTGNKAIIVTAERFLFALGAGGDPRKVQWCDRENLTQWTPAVTNEAGDITLQTNGNIICAEKVRGRTLILTSLDAHVATYQGPPTVYGFQRLASGCGVAGPLLSTAISGMAFWMGESQFFMYNGSTVTPIQCDVHDHVFKNINREEIGSAFCVTNQKFNEVWWFYPSGGSKENDKYVVYDYLENHWSVGDLDRSTGVDSGVFQYPHWIESTGEFYQHEKGFNHGGGKAFAETGPMRMNEGNRVLKVNSVIPEEDTQGEVEITFKTRFYPNDTETSHGPFNPANPTDVRFTGRQVRLRIDGDVGADWRFGKMRMRGKEGGYR